MVFRPDRLQGALIEYVIQGLEISSISGNTHSFKTIYEKEISKDIPVLFIVSTGFDPSK
jgi:hypothetical protein